MILQFGLVALWVVFHFCLFYVIIIKRVKTSTLGEEGFCGFFDTAQGH